MLIKLFTSKSWFIASTFCECFCVTHQLTCADNWNRKGMRWSCMSWVEIGYFCVEFPGGKNANKDWNLLISLQHFRHNASLKNMSKYHHLFVVLQAVKNLPWLIKASMISKLDFPLCALIRNYLYASFWFQLKPLQVYSTHFYPITSHSPALFLAMIILNTFTRSVAFTIIFSLKNVQLFIPHSSCDRSHYHFTFCWYWLKVMHAYSYVLSHWSHWIGVVQSCAGIYVFVPITIINLTCPPRKKTAMEAPRGPEKLLLLISFYKKILRAHIYYIVYIGPK